MLRSKVSSAKAKQCIKSGKRPVTWESWAQEGKCRPEEEVRFLSRFYKLARAEHDNYP